MQEEENFRVAAIAAQVQWCDIYTWRATYRDGTCTNEYDESRPDGRGWAEREAKEVATITLARASDGTEVQSVSIPEDAEPVFFRRRSLVFGLTDDSVQQKGTLAHCIGWTHGEEADYLFVFDNGQTLHTNDLQAV